MDAWRPTSADEALDAVRDALAERSPLELAGAGGRRALGRPVEARRVLSLAGLSGIVDFQPEELVVTIRPGTPLADLETELAAKGQHLAFEPPDLGPLLGRPAGQGTIGGVAMVGFGGPRRLAAGAPRDHILGLKGVNGFGEPYATGGRVMKNVTGFDLPKLMAGSFGTLTVVTELTFRTLPSPADTLTLVLEGLDDEAAVRAMAEALGSAAAVTGAAHVPGQLAHDDLGRTFLRLEGFTPSVRARAEHLEARLAGRGPIRRLDAQASQVTWRAIADVAPLAGGEGVVWRISVAPSRAPSLGAALGGRRFYDAGGGLLWLELPPCPDAHADRVRKAVSDVAGGGHATLVRAPAEVRAVVPPFHPPDPALAALQARVKRQFDPRGMFNPGRMYAET